MGADSYLQFISILIIFIAVLGATYYVTKWIANYQKGAESGKNIDIVETCRISTSKYVQIVRIGSRYVAIGVSKDNITNLGDVPTEDLDFSKASENAQGFKDVFEKIKSEIKK